MPPRPGPVFGRLAEVPLVEVDRGPHTPPLPAPRRREVVEEGVASCVRRIADAAEHCGKRRRQEPELGSRLGKYLPAKVMEKVLGMVFALVGILVLLLRA